MFAWIMIPCLSCNCLVHNVLIFEVVIADSSDLRRFVVEAERELAARAGGRLLHGSFGKECEELGKEPLVHVPTHLVQDEPVAY